MRVPPERYITTLRFAFLSWSRLFGEVRLAIVDPFVNSNRFKSKHHHINLERTICRYHFHEQERIYYRAYNDAPKRPFLQREAPFYRWKRVRYYSSKRNGAASLTAQVERYMPNPSGRSRRREEERGFNPPTPISHHLHPQPPRFHIPTSPRAKDRRAGLWDLIQTNDPRVIQASSWRSNRFLSTRGTPLPFY